MKKNSEMVPLTNMMHTLLGPDTTLAFRGVKVVIGTWQHCPLLLLLPSPPYKHKLCYCLASHSLLYVLAPIGG